ncbi:MAG: MerR family transcriptional regulator, partial [Alphaproteobacteria bacterium]
MLTSKQLIEITGISRATMNNYVAWGLLPRPEVKKPEGAGERARQLGYFPDEAVDRVAEIQDLKKQGLTMDQIIARLVGGNVAAEAPALAADVQATAVSDGGIRLTLEGLDQPAYMVNYNFLVEWSNPAATRDLFGIAGELPSEISARSLFKLMLNSAAARPWADRAGLLGFLVAVAKVRLPRQSLAVLGSDVAADDLAALEDLYDDTAPVRTGMVCESHLNLAAPEEEPRWQTVFASFYREGILFAHQSSQAPSETFLELLSRRDQLIRTVVADRKPVLTPVCTLVA